MAYLILGMVIGANNFAIALALGALGQQARVWRVVLVFGVIEFTVPLLGLVLGRALVGAWEAASPLVTPVLLAALGGWTLYAATRPARDAQRLASQVTTWWGVFALGFSISLDNLAVGLALGVNGFDPLLAALSITLFAMMFTWIGLRIGGRIHRRWHKSAEYGAGVLLILLALATALGWL